MIRDHDRVLDELPLPLGADADVLEALGIAVAVEDACGVVLPEDRITVSDLGSKETLTALLRQLAGPD